MTKEIILPAWEAMSNEELRIELSHFMKITRDNFHWTLDSDKTQDEHKVYMRYVRRCARHAKALASYYRQRNQSRMAFLAEIRNKDNE